MRVTQSSTFKAEDFPSQRAWIPAFFLPLNRLLQELVRVINGGLTPEDNSKSVLKTLSGRIILPFSFSWSFPQTAPISLSVCQAVRSNVGRAVVVGWEYSAGTVSIVKLVDAETGLSINQEDNWTIVLRCSV
jgi:hypothetical protein